MKEDEIGVACGPCGAVENLMERDLLEDLGVHGRIIVKLRLKKYCAEVDWIHVAGRRDRWRALVNTVIKLLIVEFQEFVEYLCN
jgi:hypothetical protein